MTFEVDDRVKATEDLEFSDKTITDGTKGTVKSVNTGLPSGNVYKVSFDGDSKLRIANENQLESA